MTSQRFRFRHFTPGRFILGRFVAISCLMTFLWIGGIGISSQRAIAATHADTAPYDSGPIRKSRNPLSDENFQGGVDQSALEQREQTGDRPLDDEDKNLIDTLKDLLPGQSSGEAESPSPRSRVEPERNPTLERYTEQGGMR